MSRVLKKFLAATSFGSGFGAVVGVMYAVSEQSILGGVVMFFGMILFVYFAWSMMELLFFVWDWIDR